MTGRFITIEGPDGAGKSTQISLLSQYLSNKGYDIILTREPGGTEISEKIREIILDSNNKEMSDATEALLYAASRAQHVNEKIIPALNDNKIVICDRYVHSSLVYQGIGRNLGVDKIRNINEFATGGVKPDVTLFFNIDPEVALKRKKESSKADRLEQEDMKFHRSVYEGYLKLIEMYPSEFKIIDAGKNEGEVFDAIKDIIEMII